MRLLGCLLLVAGVLTACAGIPFAQQGPGQALVDAGTATGNPLLYVAGTILTGIGTYVAARKKAAEDDDKEWTGDEADAMAAKQRERGYDVKRQA